MTAYIREADAIGDATLWLFMTRSGPKRPGLIRRFQAGADMGAEARNRRGDKIHKLPKALVI